MNILDEIKMILIYRFIAPIVARQAINAIYRHPAKYTHAYTQR